MYKIDIDGSLKCQLYSSSDKGIEDKTNIIFVPGLGSVGKSKKEIINRVIQTQPDTNLVTFLYKSHQGNTLKNLEGDIDDLGEVVNRLETFGLSRNNIGFLGVCYGSYLAARFLSEENGYRCAIMIEPFLGMTSLKTYAKCTLGLANMLSGVGVRKIPIGHRYSQKAYAYPKLMIKDMSKEVPIIKGTPLLAMTTDYHKFLNRGYIEDWVKASGGDFKIIKEENKRAAINQITNAISEFKDKENGSN